MTVAPQQSPRMAAGPTPRFGAVRAQVQFIVAGGPRPYSYEYEPPAGVPRRNATYEARRILIQDARRLMPGADLDLHGFTLLRQRTHVRDFYDAAEVEAVYYPEVVRLLQQATGARRILIFDHTVRGDARSNRNGTAIKEPVHRAHNDYTPASGPRRVRDLLPKGSADWLLQHRVLEVNVWRPIRGPLKTMPLAVCDATSMRRDDFVACDLYYRDRTGEIHYIAHDERQRWYYYPDMTRDEALLFKCFDSDPARGRPGAHAAFRHPHTPHDAPPRESIEVRAFAFFA